MTSTSGKNIAVADSDALIGLIFEEDPLHERCLKVSEYLNENRFEVLVPYSIVLEAATVLTKDKTIKRPNLAKQLLEKYTNTEFREKFDLEILELVS